MNRLLVQLWMLKTIQVRAQIKRGELERKLPSS